MDESTHLPPMWPGFNSRTGVEFVVGSRPYPERFSPGSLGCPHPSKIKSPNRSRLLFYLMASKATFLLSANPLYNLDCVVGSSC